MFTRITHRGLRTGKTSQQHTQREDARVHLSVAARGNERVRCDTCLQEITRGQPGEPSQQILRRLDPQYPMGQCVHRMALILRELDDRAAQSLGTSLPGRSVRTFLQTIGRRGTCDATLGGPAQNAGDPPNGLRSRPGRGRTSDQGIMSLIASHFTTC